MSKYICVLDFEANCAEDLKALGMDNEVIEFPSVLLKVDGITVTKIGEFQLYCKPKHTPILTPFCKELTKITQDKVDVGVSFPDALKQHEMWLRSNIPDFDEHVKLNKFVIITCGRWDLAVMAPKEYQNYNIKNVHSIYKRFINIKQDFCTFYKKKKQLGMDGMLNELKLKLDGTHHCGLDDCRNISKIVIKMFTDGMMFDTMNVVNI
jgi:ERI1 exoribonuclease 3